MSPISRFRRAILIGVAATALVLALIWTRAGNRTSAPVTILHRPLVVPMTARDRVFIALGRGRFGARVADKLFGERKSVDIKSHVFSAGAEQVGNFEKSVGLGPAVFTNAAGLRIWFVPRSEVQGVNDKIWSAKDLAIVTHPRIVTAEGIASSVSFGSSVFWNGARRDVGFNMQCIVRPEKNSTELLTAIVDSEFATNWVISVDGTNTVAGHPIVTNLNIRARLEVPKGNGVVLIQSPREGSGGKGFGCLIEPIQ